MCGVLLSTNDICPAHGVWLTVCGSQCVGSQCVAHSVWITVCGSRCVAHDVWLTMCGSQCVAHGAWLTAHGSLCVAHCMRLTAHGSLCVAQPPQTSTKHQSYLFSFRVHSPFTVSAAAPLLALCGTYRGQSERLVVYPQNLHCADSGRCRDYTFELCVKIWSELHTVASNVALSTRIAFVLRAAYSHAQSKSGRLRGYAQSHHLVTTHSQRSCTLSHVTAVRYAM